MKKLISILLIISMLTIALCSCGKSSQQTTNTTKTPETKVVQPIETEPKSAVDQLNDDEKKIYNTITPLLTSFNAPNSVVITEIGYYSLMNDESKYCFLIVSSQGTVKYYMLSLDDGDFSEISGYPDVFYNKVTTKDSSVPKLNAALKEYKEKMGWN